MLAHLMRIKTVAYSVGAVWGNCPLNGCGAPFLATIEVET